MKNLVATSRRWLGIPRKICTMYLPWNDFQISKWKST